MYKCRQQYLKVYQIICKNDKKNTQVGMVGTEIRTRYTHPLLFTSYHNIH